MAFSKAHRFNPADYHYSLLLRALCHPARIAILRKLHNHGPCTFKFLQKGMYIAEPTVSQHLKILRDMHIVYAEQQTPITVYWLNHNLPNTYRCIVDLLIYSANVFDSEHLSEISAVSRLPVETVSGI